MKELFLTTITQPPEVLLNTFFSVFVSVSFFIFTCSKGHSVRAYLDTIQMTLDCSRIVIGKTMGTSFMECPYCPLKLLCATPKKFPISTLFSEFLCESGYFFVEKTETE